MQISPYLTFNGNCREAMLFYQKCLGGHLFIQTLGETPQASALPVRMRNAILHATLTNSKLTIMATDMVGDSGLKTGNAVSILLLSESEKEIKKLFRKLGEGAEIIKPIETTETGDLFGQLRDRYGLNWLLQSPTK